MSLDLGWIIALVAVWLFSSIAEGRKGAGKRNRRPRVERAPPPADTGPAAGQRDLARDLAEGARRAEEALRRWEARQQSRQTDEERRAAVDLRRRTAGRMFDVARDAPDADRRARDTRRDAYEAISEMLSERLSGAEQAPRRVPAGERGERPPTEVVRRPISGSELERPRSPSPRPGTPDALRRARTAGIRGGPGRARGGRRESASGGGPENGLARLDRLPLLQRAIVLRELLGPPKALDPGQDVY